MLTCFEVNGTILVSILFMLLKNLFVARVQSFFVLGLNKIYNQSISFGCTNFCDSAVNELFKKKTGQNYCSHFFSAQCSIVIMAQ